MDGWVDVWVEEWREGGRSTGRRVGRWKDRGMDGWTGRQLDRWAARRGGWMDGWMQAEREESRQDSNARLRNLNFLRGSGSHRRFLSRGVMEREDCWRHHQKAALGSVCTVSQAGNLCGRQFTNPFCRLLSNPLSSFIYTYRCSMHICSVRAPGAWYE